MQKSQKHDALIVITQIVVLGLLSLLSTSTRDPQPVWGQVEFGAAAALAPADRNGMYDTVRPTVIDTELVYHATMQTVQGDIKFQLFADRAPITVNNFVYLARDGYYNNTTFHRVIDNFVAQGGDPTGSGSGWPGYSFEDEFDASLRFDRAGLLAMANSGPDTNGSQFFITFRDTLGLNDMHTIFGEVVEGIEILDAITRRDPSEATTLGDELLTVVIEETTPPEFYLLLPFVAAN